MLSNIQILVNTTTDTPANDANVFGATVSLREAINFASVSFDYCTVSFAPSLISSGPAKIALTQGTLRISSSMTITGLGADQLTIDGNNSTRIFTLFGSAGNAITISGLTLTGGLVVQFSIMKDSHSAIAQFTKTPRSLAVEFLTRMRAR